LTAAINISIAVPGTSPFSVWKRTSTAATSASPSAMRTMPPGNGAASKSPATRQPTRASAAIVTHAGTSTACNNSAAVIAAQTHSSGRRGVC